MRKRRRVGMKWYPRYHVSLAGTTATTHLFCLSGRWCQSCLRRQKRPTSEEMGRWVVRGFRAGVASWVSAIGFSMLLDHLPVGWRPTLVGGPYWHEVCVPDPHPL